MMKACMKCHKPTKANELKNDKPQSCAIIVRVKMTYKRRNYLALVDTGLSVTLENTEMVRECKDNEIINKVEWTT